MHGKSNENILIRHAPCKTVYVEKALRIIFDKVDRYIRNYGQTKCLALFSFNEKYERMFDKTRYYYHYVNKQYFRCLFS